MHKNMADSLLLESCSNLGGLKDMLGKEKVEKRGSLAIKAPCPLAKPEQAFFNVGDTGSAEQLAWFGPICKANSGRGAQLDAQESREINGCERLSLLGTLNVLDRMAEPPSVEDVLCILQNCRKKRNLDCANRVYAHICNNGLEAHRAVSNYIVPMFVECGSIYDAQQVFDKLVYRNERTWTSLILGLTQCGRVQYAFNLYEAMQEDSAYPSSYTLMALLKACVRLTDIKRGRGIHAEIAQKGFERDLFLGSTLVDMYAKCGSLLEAQEVFDMLPTRNVVSWSSLIAGYAEHGPGQEALNCFEQMRLEGIPPDATTFACVLKACGNVRAVDKGREIHTEITQKGLGRDLFVGSTLVVMYAKCGSLSVAQQVFDKLPVRDVVSWNTLIAGYAEHGLGKEALKCFEQMQLEGVSPSAVTFVCILKACGSIGAIGKGREIHMKIPKRMLERDIFVGNTLVGMYAKCGSLSEAREVFNKLSVRNVVSWNTLITGYAEYGSGQEALTCFEQMQLEGVSPDAVTLVCVLKACGSIGAIGSGRQIHKVISKNGFEEDEFVGHALVDMYAECGSLSEARDIFNKLLVKNVVSWSAMIKGYGLNDEGSMAVQCFEDMQEHGVKPDAITFTSVLTACSHTNLVFKGQECFKVMKKEYGIAPTMEHYTCMADILSRAGDLCQVEEFLEIMWCPPSEGMWTALLTACEMYGEAGIGLRCFQKLVKTNPESATSYVLMANIYSSAGRCDDAVE